MKSEYGYRYTLQFKNETEEQRTVGDFLERLGSKKSRFIVDVLSRYLSGHQELLDTDRSHTITVKSQSSGVLISDELRQELKSLIAQVLTDGSSVAGTTDAEPETYKEELATLLEDLDLFS